MLGTATQAVRSGLGSRPLPAHGPWVHIYVTPFDQRSMDSRVPDWEGFRARLFADTKQRANAGPGGTRRLPEAVQDRKRRVVPFQATACKHPLTVRTTGPSQRRPT